MPAIQVSDELVERLQTQGVADVEAFIESVLQQMDDAAKAQSRIATDDPEAWIADLHAAIAEFQAGLSPEKLREIVNEMNLGYISPKEYHVLASLAGDWPEEGG